MTREEFEGYKSTLNKNGNATVFKYSYEEILSLKDSYRKLLASETSNHKAMMNIGFSPQNSIWKVLESFKDVKELKALRKIIMHDKFSIPRKFTQKDIDNLFLESIKDLK